MEMNSANLSEYNNLLTSFVNSFRQNNNLNIVKYVENSVDLNDENIPNYISFLVNSNNADYLKDIMLWDYEALIAKKS